MDVADFIEAAKTYSDLGWAVQGQLDDLLDYTILEPGELNENAVAMIARFADDLYNYHGIDTNVLHEAIDEYESLVDEEEDD